MDKSLTTVADTTATAGRAGQEPAATADQSLTAALWSGDGESARRAVAAGADVNARDPRSGLTPLMIAAGRADAGMVRLLIAAGADVLAADSRAGATALHKACQGGSLAVARELAEAGAFIDAVAPTTGHTPLMDALWFKYPDIVKFLLDRGAGLNVRTRYGFSMLEHFEYELHVNVRGRDRLLLAERHLARRRRADEEAIAGQRLMAAVTGGDTAAVRELIAQGAEVDARYPAAGGFNDGHTPLLVAAREGRAQIARCLLEAGADVNATEPVFGAVPLHKAVYNGHAELTRLIAGWPGTDLDVQGATNGYTPLHDALWHGYEECASILLDAGAAVGPRGHDGKTARDLASEVFGSGHALARRVLAKRAP